jgi:macrolide-specific efflux system membrane fusion protein
VTTYVVKVYPKEVPDFMRSGMTANVTFDTDSKENVLVVPASAITEDANGSTVLVKDPAGGPPIPRAVKTGLTNGKRTEITEGLKEGEIVMTKLVSTGGKGAGRSGSSSPFGMPRVPRR